MSEQMDSGFFISKGGEEYYVDGNGNKIPKDEYLESLRNLTQEAKQMLTATELAKIKSAIKRQN